MSKTEQTIDDNNIVIIGSTRAAARERLELISDGNRIRRREGYDETYVDSHRILAMGGAEEDVCWLVGLGFHIEEIITVDPDGISEKMRKRINAVRSTLEWQRRE